jgi:hypothetical protein
MNEIRKFCAAMGASISKTLDEISETRLVPLAGLEPAQPCDYLILSLAIDAILFLSGSTIKRAISLSALAFQAWRPILSQPEPRGNWPPGAS